MTKGFSTFVESIDASEIDAKVQLPTMSFLRAHLLLQALVHAAKRGTPAEHMEDLAELAYLEAAQYVDIWAMQGVDLDSLKSLAPEQRFQRTLSAIGHLREVVTPEDVEVMARVRVPSL